MHSAETPMQTIGQFRLPSFSRTAIATFVMKEGIFHLPLANMRHQKNPNLSKIPKVPKHSDKSHTLIISTRHKVLNFPAFMSLNHWHHYTLIRIRTIVLRKGLSLQQDVRLNVFVSDFVPDSKVSPEQHMLQMKGLYTVQPGDSELLFALFHPCNSQRPQY